MEALIFFYVIICAISVLLMRLFAILFGNKNVMGIGRMFLTALLLTPVGLKYMMYLKLNKSKDGKKS